MSMCYWGVVMHGVSENDLKFTDEMEEGIKDILDEYYDGNIEISVTLPNGKKVILDYEKIEGDGGFFGFIAGYPWETRLAGLTEEDVNNAIVQFLGPYVSMSRQEILDEIEDISTYNYG